MHAFASKFVLPDPVDENMADVAKPSAMMSDFVLVRECLIRRELFSLRDIQASGMDELLQGSSENAAAHCLKVLGILKS